MSFADIITTGGVALILLAFLLQTANKISGNDKSYHLLNLIGAGLACYGAVLINSLPFVVLEAIWAVVAVYGLMKN